MINNVKHSFLFRNLSCKKFCLLDCIYLYGNEKEQNKLLGQMGERGQLSVYVRVKLRMEGTSQLESHSDRSGYHTESEMLGNQLSQGRISP